MTVQGAKGAAVVVGARGLIGSAITDALLREGREVVAVDLRPGGGASAAHELVVDARDRPSVIALVADAERLAGPIDVLVNCGAARPSGMFARLEDVQAAEFEEVLRTHVVGTFLTCQQFGARMAERGRGSIVNLGSIYGVVGPDQRIYGDSGFHAVASYSAAKGGIIALSRYLATHWGERGVRVNTVSPGGVFNNEPPDFVRAYSNRVPLGRMARVDEVVSIVMYLVSPSASYVTGQNLLVDGGLTAW